MSNTNNLNIILEKLNQLKSKKYKSKFNIPGLWLGSENGKVEINPYQFFIERIEKIKSESENPNPRKDKLIYNMYIRLSASYDHNNDGNISYSDEQFRETGTFLKAIAMLPYIKSMGVNTIYLLPITAIGEDGKKGDLGSPYSIRNPYKQDENLSEPLLELDEETEFKAFSEAVHLLGMDLVCEFIFRTASIDSDLTLEHPEWFYWINNKVKNREIGDNSEAKYGSPIFLKKELNEIVEKVNSGDLNDLPSPHEQYKKMFTEAPKKVARVEGKIRGLLGDKKTEVRIPSAFADWPPNDNQPAWSDVTYLKLYEHHDFNYIAYNTIRMYDNSLATKKNINKELWDYITNIIPHYIDNFDIDGVMIDMGHALPHDLQKNIIKKALEKKKDFYFWEENFDISEKSLEEGFSAVLGYLIFDAHQKNKMKDLIARFARKDLAINFFLSPENHNTPRSFARISDTNYLKSIYALTLFLPALTFIHSGFELAESQPVNTGLDFTNEEIEQYPAEKLGLFSSTSLNWNNENEITSFIRKVNEIKSQVIEDKDDIKENDIFNLDSNNDNIVGFLRRDKSTKNEIIIASNYSSDATNDVEISSLAGATKLINLLNPSEEINIIDGIAKINFTTFEPKILKLEY